VLNSVIQYFPSVEYLVRVLEGAAQRLAPGGQIFIGDVRSLALLPALHADVALHRAEADDPASTLRQAMIHGMMQEEELVAAPGLFPRLVREISGLGDAELHLKPAASDNELTAFRYDVVLSASEDLSDDSSADPSGDGARIRTQSDSESAPFSSIRYGDTHGIHQLTSMLKASTAPALQVRSIPNARALRAEQVAQTLAHATADSASSATAASIRDAVADTMAFAASDALWAGQLYDLGASLGYEVEVSPRPSDPAQMDVLFYRNGRRPLGVHEPAVGPLRDLATRPLFGRFVRHIVPQLRTALGESLPEYMVPSEVVLLDEFPLLPNGKLDRRALPAPGAARTDARGFVAPETPSETAVASIWMEVLGLRRVGVEANFFDLGGHSLLATQVVSRLRSALGVEVALRALFEHQTVRTLADHVDTLLWIGGASGHARSFSSAAPDSADEAWESGAI
jgi:acyl carrier protein